MLKETSSQFDLVITLYLQNLMPQSLVFQRSKINAGLLPHNEKANKEGEGEGEEDGRKKNKGFKKNNCPYPKSTKHFSC